MVLKAANSLLANNRLSMVKLGGGKLLYQATDPAQAAKMRGLDGQQMLILQLIEKTADKGAWSKWLKDQSNLQQHTISKITKELARRSLIKEVKSVQNRNRKVFMMYDVEPSREVTGGTWYHDGEFATGWIETLRERCQECLSSNGGRAITLKQIHLHVIQQPGPTVPTEDDIAAIMRTLELDEEVFSLQSGVGRVYSQRRKGFDIFAARTPSYIREPTGERPMLTVPCIQCPLESECCVGGRVSPDTCEYISRWLSGEDAAARQDAAAAGRPSPMDVDERTLDW
eukprot:gnl/TRDRNA2_/TRDRNA2_161997_c0_seq1.p1 gnl/TRDRNA2_/TRDRNA2_161997_c0~~gnl/TRDRNA2_/TRDRNA2_161997_c0_seq1.p1  ORF type:complete len:320 (-),score=63.26 gnl/TRDRNA2_/TRDRNA2_161997_c0_seq1:56-910(-)